MNNKNVDWWAGKVFESAIAEMRNINMNKKKIK